MIERAVSAGIPFSWVTADEAYGDNGPLRTFLKQEGIAYVLAVARDHLVARPRDRAGPTPWPRPGPGTRSAAGTAPRAAAGMTGRCSPRLGRRSRRWCAAPSPGRQSWPSTGATPRGRPRPLPGQALQGLVPLRHPRHARPGLARRHPRRPRRRQRRPIDVPVDVDTLARTPRYQPLTTLCLGRLAVR